MRIEDLKAGEHLTQGELNFVNDLVIPKIRGHYNDVIYVVGGRAEGRWISAHEFDNELDFLPVSHRVSLFHQLNERAREARLSAGQAHELVKYFKNLDGNVVFFLHNSNVGADLDLRLDIRAAPKIFDGPIRDTNPKGTGLSVDIWDNSTPFSTRWEGFLRNRRYKK